MIISDNAIQNRTSVLVLAFIIYLTGIYCYISFPIDFQHFPLNTHWVYWISKACPNDQTGLAALILLRAP